MKETEIEVFRAGTRASRGITADQIAEVAAFDCSANPVGICFGHPASDTPAAGTISKLRAAGNSLFATVSTLTDKAVDGIKNNEWLNRSFAFFDPQHEANPTPGKWAPRHLGLLGASAPGIPGMGSLKQALAFDADGGLTAEGDPADAVIYAPEPTPVHFIFTSKEPVTMEKTPEQIAAETALAERTTAQEKRETEFAARVRSQFEAGNSSIVDGLVTAGKVLPTEAADLKLVFNAFPAEGDELTFSADRKGSPAGELGAFLAKVLPARVDTSGATLSPTGEFAATDTKSADAITAAATALVEKTPGLTFEAAVERVSAAG